MNKNVSPLTLAHQRHTYSHTNTHKIKQTVMPKSAAQEEKKRSYELFSETKRGNTRETESPKENRMNERHATPHQNWKQCSTSNSSNALRQERPEKLMSASSRKVGGEKKREHNILVLFRPEYFSHFASAAPLSPRVLTTRLFTTVSAIEKTVSKTTKKRQEETKRNGTKRKRCRKNCNRLHEDTRRM